MFAKIFESIYDGSLRKDWKALVVFQQLLILSDEKGYVDKTADAISARTTIPLAIIEHGIAELCKKDPDSRSQEEEGRRLVLINPARQWGWRIVNHASYRGIKTQEDLRNYWAGKKREQRQDLNGNHSGSIEDFKQVIDRMFRRKASLVWDNDEEHYISEIYRRPDVRTEWKEIVAYQKRNPKYFPKSVRSLLRNWNPTLDQARQPEFKPLENAI